MYEAEEGNAYHIYQLKTVQLVNTTEIPIVKNTKWSEQQKADKSIAQNRKHQKAQRQQKLINLLLFLKILKTAQLGSPPFLF
jgi:hypothetical protein